MRNSIRNLIQQIGFLMEDGKIDRDCAFGLMQDVAKIYGESEAEIACSYAAEQYVRADNLRIAAQKKQAAEVENEKRP